MIVSSSEAPVWGQQWRSSSTFIVASMGMAQFTDMFLYTFIVPILPYMSETRLGLDASHTQNMSFALLSETAIVTVILVRLLGIMRIKQAPNVSSINAYVNLSARWDPANIK